MLLAGVTPLPSLETPCVSIAPISCVYPANPIPCGPYLRFPPGPLEFYCQLTRGTLRHTVAPCPLVAVAVCNPAKQQVLLLPSKNRPSMAYAMRIGRSANYESAILYLNKRSNPLSLKNLG